MLVVTRHAREGIRVGDDTLIQILDFEKDKDGNWQARVGILAPQNKRILREELWNANQIAGASDGNN